MLLGFKKALYRLDAKVSTILSSTSQNLTLSPHRRESITIGDNISDLLEAIYVYDKHVLTSTHRVVGKDKKDGLLRFYKISKKQVKRLLRPGLRLARKVRSFLR